MENRQWREIKSLWWLAWIRTCDSDWRVRVLTSWPLSVLVVNTAKIDSLSLCYSEYIHFTLVIRGIW